MLKKLYSILTKQERLMASWLTILTIFALLFEVFGLAMIFPVISLLLDEEFTTNNYILIEINNLMESSGLKDSPLKLFLVATAKERGKRRFKQLKEKGISVRLADLIDEISARDKRDSERSVAPLKPAEDAIIIDTTGLSIEEVMMRVMTEVERCLGIKTQHENS